MTWLFVLLTILFWGSAPILEKLGLSKASPYEAIAIRTLVIAILVLFSSFISGHLFSAFKLDSKTLIFVIVGGLFAGLLGQYTYFMALRGSEASKVVPLTAAFPLVTAILGTVLLRESFSAPKLVGVFLIIGGALLLR